MPKKQAKAEIKIKKACEVAAEAHAGQYRKDGETPYITHPLAVYQLLLKVTDDAEILCAGLLHDVLEDSDITRKKLEKQFGKRVAGIVQDVTNNKEGVPPLKTQEGIMVKLADILHNISSNPSEKQVEKYRKLLCRMNKLVDESWVQKPDYYEGFEFEPSNTVWKKPR